MPNQKGQLLPAALQIDAPEKTQVARTDTPLFGYQDKESQMVLTEHSSVTGQYLSVKGLSLVLGVSVNTIYYWLSIHSDLPHHRIGRHLRFELKKVIAFWDSRSPPQACLPKSFELKPGRSKRSLKIEGVGRAGLRKESRHGNS